MVLNCGVPTLLQAQQVDFIQRLKLGYPLHCETERQHSELTIISGKRLDQLIDFCWEMAEKYNCMKVSPKNIGKYFSYSTTTASINSFPAATKRVPV